MNILRTLSLGCAVFSAQVCLADYDGGPISNYDGTYTGEIRITGTSQVRSGVSRTSSGITTLQGNIYIDLLYGSGVENYGYSEYAVGTNLILETQSASDSIVIKTVSKGSGGNDADGISHQCYNGSTMINANKDGSFQELNITAGNNGISALAEGFYINANTVINAGGYGIGTGSTTFASDQHTTNGHITMTGTVDITSKGNGISAGWGVVDLSGTTKTTINTSSSAGIRAGGTGGTVYLGSHLEIISSSSSSSFLAICTGSTCVISGTGQYTFSGQVDADYNSTIDLTFTAGSSFTGFTTKKTGNSPVIDFSFNKGARWELTTNSTMNTLNVDEGGVIVFDLFDVSSKQFAYIRASEVTLGAGSILALNMDPDLVKEGDQYTLFTGVRNTFYNDTDGELNAILRSADGKYEYTYDNPSAGVFRILGIYSVIPEPASASLALFGFAGLFMRSRR